MENKNQLLCGEDNSNETIVESTEKCKAAWEEFKNELFRPIKTAIFNEDKVTDGLKHDGGKARLDLVPPEIIEAIGAVRSYGVQKYKEEYSYRKVDPKRYRAALMRHICKWLKNPHGLDADSGLPHLWHIACNVAFLLELDKGGEGDA
jgi:hypothetical protein